nr:MAG TPA: hypothetical protein [Caudoviricetes sp.]
MNITYDEKPVHYAKRIHDASAQHHTEEMCTHHKHYLS